MAICTQKGCDSEVRMAVRTTRPTREGLKVMIYPDDRVAPKTAQRYCKFHGLRVVKGLVVALVHED